MTPQSHDGHDAGEEAPPFPTPWLALGLVGFAALLRMVFAGALYPLLGPRPSLVGITAILAFGLVFAFAAQRIPPPAAEHLGFRSAVPRSWRAVLFLLPGLILVSELDNVARDLLPAPPDATDRPAPDVGALMEWGLVLIVVLPFTQELFFRGLLQPGVVASIGRRLGVPMVAALQGLAVLPLLGPRAALFALATALVLGFLRESARSLRPCLALNALFGLATVLSQAGAFGIPGFDDTSAPHTPLEWLLPAAMLFGVGLGLCRSTLREPPSRPDAPLIPR